MATDYQAWLVKILVLLTLLLAADNQVSAANAQAKVYQLELARWHVYNDGTHPVETTAGLNQALQYASSQGYNVFQVPAGTYLIAKGTSGRDPNGQINMVSNMAFVLDDRAVIQKESNSYPSYHTLYVGGFVHDVILKGGTYRGDRDTHDYSSGGTHEGGYGILTEGSSNVVIDGVRSERFTGDGLAIGGYNAYFQDVYEASFESGALDAAGQPVPAAGNVRTKTSWKLTDPSFSKTHQFSIDNVQQLPYTFDVYFYKADGAFLSEAPGQRKGDYMAIPDGAVSFRLVFKTSSFKGAYLEIWNKVQSQNVVVRNSEFAFNRRQGITVGGGDNVLIVNNKLHDQSGTAPQSGIDVEGGAGNDGYLNSFIAIKDNEFFNNKAYDVILYDGHDAIVEGNRLGSRGAIGLAVSPPFSGAMVNNNTFEGSRLIAYHDVQFQGNQMTDSYTHLEGPNISIDGMTFTDSQFIISSVVPFGVSASNITITNNKKSSSGLSIWNQPVQLRNITINGESTQRSLSGGVAEGSIFENLKVLGYNSAYGLDLPRGTYKNCVFEASSSGKVGPAVNQSGKYVFDQCSFKGPGAGLGIYQKDADVSVKRSTFNVLGNASAVFVSAAKSVDIEDNTIEAANLTSADTQIIGIGDYWHRQDPYKVQQAAIKGNDITANLAAKGISTLYAGTGAPPYDVENNILHKAKLALKPNDINKNNQELN